MKDIEHFKKIGQFLNSNLEKINYQVAPKKPAGSPAKNDKSAREYRLQLINKQNDTSDKCIKELKKIILSLDGVSRLNFNELSPNSSKFPSYEFYFNDKKYDIIIAKGANRGEKFEVKTVNNLEKFFKTREGDMANLIKLMCEANSEFDNVEIYKVKQRTGSTKKAGVPIERLGEIIGDIVLTDTSNKNWFISLKDINGNTFSSYSGASSLFDSKGNLKEKSEGAEFLSSFGVDLNKVQEGFDERNKIKTPRKTILTKKQDNNKIKQIFYRAWGMNYFYVRKQSQGWKVFWMNKDKLDSLSTKIKVTQIKYPNTRSKQLSIFLENSYAKYLIEIRNSKGGEYPNDIKFKIL